MIAKLVLRFPEGLYWKWKTYRKTSGVTTLCKLCWPRDELEILNVLTRTCRTAYNELQGLFLTLSTYHFCHIAAIERVPESSDIFQGLVHLRPVLIVFHLEF